MQMYCRFFDWGFDSGQNKNTPVPEAVQSVCNANTQPAYFWLVSPEMLLFSGVAVNVPCQSEKTFALSGPAVVATVANGVWH